MAASGVIDQTVLRVAPTSDDAASADGLHAAFQRCGPALYRYAAVRLGDAHLAEDALQQLWLCAERGARDVPPGELEYWLRGVLANLVRTHWRRQRTRPPHVPLAEPALAGDLARRIDSQDLPDDLLARREVRGQLLLAITQLPAAQQELIVEHYFHSRPQAELAARNGVSPRAIEGRLYRARRSLREALERLET